ncbi:MAG: hypothetical protein JOZ37_03255 [Actinobacteria bacterium]|nr:hypothetical protein [Actinomycetota bacterium]MBV9662959.1 hypothetical protein [Actinomycetota bacterium]
MALEVERRRAEERRTVDRRWSGASRPLGFDDRRALPDRRAGAERRHFIPVERRHLRLLPPPELRPTRADVLDRLIPVVLLVALSVADLITTRALQARGGVELNPVGRWLIGHGALAEAKLIVATGMAGLALLARSRRWIAHALWFVAGIYAAVIGIHIAQLLTVH